MKDVRLLIARHGETDYNKNGLLQGRGIDAPLNATGFEQAKALAGYLGGYTASYLGASSLLRTAQTARFFSESSRLEINQNPNLDEMDFGDFEGRSYIETADELERINTEWRRGHVSLKLPGGESPQDVYDRANQAVHEIISAQPNQTVVLVIHGRLIRILLSEWLGYGLKNMDKINHFNCCVNQLVFKTGRFETIYLNKTDHLTPIMKDTENE